MDCDEFRKEVIKLAREFYKTNSNETTMALTYVDLGCPYNGNVNVMQIRVWYPHGKPTKEKYTTDGKGNFYEKE